MKIVLLPGEKGLSATTIAISDDEALVINPSSTLMSFDEFLAKEKVRVVAILVSGSHLHQVARAADLQTKYAVPLYASQDLLLYLNAIPSSADRYGLCGVKVPRIDRFVDEKTAIQVGQETVTSFVLGERGALHFRLADLQF